MQRKVTFLPQNVTVEVEDGDSIIKAATIAGVDIVLPCAGQGRCGKCKVSVTGVTGLDGKDQLKNSEWEAGVRMACVSSIEGDCTVMVSSPIEQSISATVDHTPLRDCGFSPLTDKGFGLAIDIGTTTVAVTLIDLSDGSEVRTYSDYNNQVLLGEDVLSRMEFAAEGGTERLRGLVLKTINGMISNMREAYSGKMVMAATVAANTVMGHLFLGVDPSPLRNPPFLPLVNHNRLSGADSGLDINPKAEVVVIPCLSSYVGGDVTADVLHSGMHSDPRLTLLIDVGTNGEVVLGNEEFLIACSSSAGPAFEGGEMECGTRACPGAVETVSIKEGEFRLGIIGDAEPIGFCGSGLIDLVAQLFLDGRLDKNGRFADGDGLTDDDDTRRLIIPSSNGLTISENEVQSIMRTKAAIFAAGRSLLKNLGMDFKDLDRVLIAGGFGRHINLDNAISIGLLPDLPRDRFEFIGNAALAGAKSALMCQVTRDEMTELIPRMTYLDLSNDPAFFDEYSSALFLPHTDSSLFPSSESRSL